MDLFTVAQDRIQQRFGKQNMDLFTVAQDRIQQRFGEQNMDLFTVFVMMLGSWSSARTTGTGGDGTTRLRLPAGVRHGWVRVLSGYYVYVESQAETWMLPAFEG